MLESMLKICIYTGINADVTLEDARTTECEDRARILKQNSQNSQTCEFVSPILIYAVLSRGLKIAVVYQKLEISGMQADKCKHLDKIKVCLIAVAQKWSGIAEIISLTPHSSPSACTALPSSAAQLVSLATSFSSATLQHTAFNV